MSYTKKEVLTQINQITITAQKMRSTTGVSSEIMAALLGGSNKLNSSHVVTLGTKICNSDNPAFIDVYNFYVMIRRNIVLDVQLLVNEIEPYDLSMQEIMELFGS